MASCLRAMDEKLEALLGEWTGGPKQRGRCPPGPRIRTSDATPTEKKGNGRARQIREWGVSFGEH